MRIVEANLTALSPKPKREPSPPRAPIRKKTRHQKRIELIENLACAGHAIKNKFSTREFFWCARCGRAGRLQNWKWSPGRVPQCWFGMIGWWKRPPSMFRLLLPRCAATTRTLSAMVVRWRQRNKVAAPHRGKRVRSSRLRAPRKEIGAGKWCGASQSRVMDVAGLRFLWEVWRVKLLTKACKGQLNTRVTDLERFSRGQEPNCRTVLP